MFNIKKRTLVASLGIMLMVSGGVVLAFQPPKQESQSPVNNAAPTEVKKETPPIEEQKKEEPAPVVQQPEVAKAEPVAAPVPQPAEPQPSPIGTWPWEGGEADWKIKSGVAQANWQAMDYIFAQESSYRPDAVNAKGCIGLGQSCPGGSGLATDCPNWRLDPVCQIKHFDKYAQNRYGGWGPALQFHKANGWW